MIVFQGRSLAFVRTLKGLPAKYPSATEAYVGQAEVRYADDDPPVGAVTWYETARHGNCALVVGPHQVLALNSVGVPVIIGMRVSWLGEYLGWTETIR
jgi:hypothetical protein